MDYLQEKVVSGVCTECKKRDKILELLIDDCNEPPHSVNIYRIKQLVEDLK